MVSSISSSSGLLSGLNKASSRPDPEEMFKTMDKNGDGVVTKDELSESFSEKSGAGSFNVDDIFTQVDTDGDGSITYAEHAAQMKKMEGQRPPMGGAQGAPPPPPPDSTEMFDEIDTNGDGGIDKDEMTTFLANMTSQDGNAPSVDDIFSKMDTDGDGLISEEEHTTALEKMEEERQAAMAAQDDQSQAATLLTTLLNENADKIEKYAQNSVTQAVASTIKLSI